MKHFTLKWQVAIFSTLLFLFSLPKISYAYVDPGTGSYIFQILIAGFFASIFFFKSALKRAKGVVEQIFFSRRNNEHE